MFEKGYTPWNKGKKMPKDVVERARIWDINNGITLCKKCHKLTDNYGEKAKKK
mgnify:CR=1 FL=1